MKIMPAELTAVRFSENLPTVWAILPAHQCGVLLFLSAKPAGIKNWKRRTKMEQWNGFKNGIWQNEINVRDFIQKNYTPYEGDESFLAKATDRTEKLNAKLSDLLKEEQRRGGVYDIDTETVK